MLPVADEAGGVEAVELLLVGLVLLSVSADDDDVLLEELLAEGCVLP